MSLAKNEQNDCWGATAAVLSVVALCIIGPPCLVLYGITKALSIVAVLPLGALIRGALPLIVAHIYPKSVGKVYVTILKLVKWIERVHRGYDNTWHSQPLRVDISVPGGKCCVHVVSALMDNYMYLIVDVTSPPPYKAAFVDASDGQAACRAVEYVEAHHYGEPIDLVAILSSHEHWDHTYGNRHLLNTYKSIQSVYGGFRDQVDCCTEYVKEGDQIRIGSLRVDVLQTPCHTKGSVVYRLLGQDGRDALFTGDTLFLGGCGATFEGKESDVLRNFWKIRSRCTPETLLFPGHEYTMALLTDSFVSNSRSYSSRPARFFSLCAAYARSAHLRSIEWPLPTVPWALKEEMLYNRYFLETSGYLRILLLAWRCGEILRACGGDLTSLPSTDATGPAASTSPEVGQEHFNSTSEFPRDAAIVTEGAPKVFVPENFHRAPPPITAETLDCQLDFHWASPSPASAYASSPAMAIASELGKERTDSDDPACEPWNIIGADEFDGATAQQAPPLRQRRPAAPSVAGHYGSESSVPHHDHPQHHHLNQAPSHRTRRYRRLSLAVAAPPSVCRLPEAPTSSSPSMRRSKDGRRSGLPPPSLSCFPAAGTPGARPCCADPMVADAHPRVPSSSLPAETPIDDGASRRVNLQRSPGAFPSSSSGRSEVSFDAPAPQGSEYHNSAAQPPSSMEAAPKRSFVPPSTSPSTDHFAAIPSSTTAAVSEPLPGQPHQTSVPEEGPFLSPTEPSRAQVEVPRVALEGLSSSRNEGSMDFGSNHHNHPRHRKSSADETRSPTARRPRHPVDNASLPLYFEPHFLRGPSKAERRRVAYAKCKQKAQGSSKSCNIWVFDHDSCSSPFMHFWRGDVEAFDFEAQDMFAAAMSLRGGGRHSHRGPRPQSPTRGKRTSAWHHDETPRRANYDTNLRLRKKLAESLSSHLVGHLLEETSTALAMDVSHPQTSRLTEGANAGSLLFPRQSRNPSSPPSSNNGNPVRLPSLLVPRKQSVLQALAFFSVPAPEELRTREPVKRRCCPGGLSTCCDSGPSTTTDYENMVILREDFFLIHAHCQAVDDILIADIWFGCDADDFSSGAALASLPPSNSKEPRSNEGRSSHRIRLESSQSSAHRNPSNPYYDPSGFTASPVDGIGGKDQSTTRGGLIAQVVRRFADFDGRTTSEEWSRFWNLLCGGARADLIRVSEAAEHLCHTFPDFADDAVSSEPSRPTASEHISPRLYVGSTPPASSEMGAQAARAAVVPKPPSATATLADGFPQRGGVGKAADASMCCYGDFLYRAKEPVVGLVPRSHYKSRCRLCQAVPVIPVSQGEDLYDRTASRLDAFV